MYVMYVCMNVCMYDMKCYVVYVCYVSMLCACYVMYVLYVYVRFDMFTYVINVCCDVRNAIRGYVCYVGMYGMSACMVCM